MTYVLLYGLVIQDHFRWRERHVISFSNWYDNPHHVWCYVCLAVWGISLGLTCNMLQVVMATTTTLTGWYYIIWHKPRWLRTGGVIHHDTFVTSWLWQSEASDWGFFKCSAGHWEEVLDITPVPAGSAHNCARALHCILKDICNSSRWMGLSTDSTFSFYCSHDLFMDAHIYYSAIHGLGAAFSSWIPIITNLLSRAMALITFPLIEIVFFN